MIATLGGLTFAGDASDATYTLAKLDGWWGGADLRHDTTHRPNGHGDFDAPGYLTGRLITLSGLIRATDATAFEAAMAALEDLLADGSKDEFAVEQASGTYTAQVRRQGEVDIDITVYGRSARYQLHLWAPDPTKVLVP